MLRSVGDLGHTTHMSDSGGKCVFVHTRLVELALGSDTEKTTQRSRVHRHGELIFSQDFTFHAPRPCTNVSEGMNVWEFPGT